MHPPRMTEFKKPTFPRASRLSKPGMPPGYQPPILKWIIYWTFIQSEIKAIILVFKFISLFLLSIFLALRKLHPRLPKSKRQCSKMTLHHEQSWVSNTTIIFLKVESQLN